MRTSKHYGRSILDLPRGSWFFDKDYYTIDFVPTGKISYVTSLHLGDNTSEEEALRVVLKYELNRLNHLIK